MRGVIVVAFFLLMQFSSMTVYKDTRIYDQLANTYPAFEPAIEIIGTSSQKQNITRWISGIVATEKGRQTLSAIIHSGHRLTIKHSYAARLSAGRTIAPMTENLTNGKGESIVIIFDANMPDYGTHLVYDEGARLIEFNALHNLYHELAHAMHKMQGSWRYFASEKQAIEEENIFRQQFAILHNEEPRLRYGKSGEVIDSFNIMYSGR